jgi:uncharacterized protein YgbK (DUF1537 family)
MDAAIFADDATGALEAGALLARSGICATVSLPDARSVFETAAGYAVSVIDTETRHMPPGEARRTLLRVGERAVQSGIRRIYKKTDSTLRGPIAAELNALAESLPGLPIVYVPAYPAVGRTVRNGLLYVDGVPLDQTDFAKDIRSPQAAASIPGLLRVETSRPVISVSSAGDLLPQLRTHRAALFVCDADRQEDLQRIGEALGEYGGEFLCAGPAGFIPIWADLIRLPRRSAPVLPKISTMLLVSGSLHPISRLQAKQAVDSGVPAIVSSGERSHDPEKIAHELAAAALAYIHRERPSAVLLFGGDTAAAVWRAMDIDTLIPLGEVLPGVPVCRSARHDSPIFITKAGGYGSADLLKTIWERMAH